MVKTFTIVAVLASALTVAMSAPDRGYGSGQYYDPGFNQPGTGELHVGGQQHGHGQAGGQLTVGGPDGHGHSGGGQLTVGGPYGQGGVHQSPQESGHLGFGSSHTHGLSGGNYEQHPGEGQLGFGSQGQHQEPLGAHGHGQLGFGVQPGQHGGQHGGEHDHHHGNHAGGYQQHGY